MADTPKPTPSPWNIRRGPGVAVWVESPTHGHVATCETVEDARLIAAAHDMLAACKRALHMIDDEEDETIAMLEAAIAKAEGA